MKNVKKLIPGAAMALVIAAAAKFLESLEESAGLHFIGASVIAMFIGIFLMVAALAAIGLNTDFKSLCRSGAKPMLHGFIISLLVVIVAIAVEFAIGIAPHGVL